jgi:hypothetical protein
MFRALLSVRNQEDLDHLYYTSPIAFGFSINGGFIQQQNHEQCYLFNYEIGLNINNENENDASKCLLINNEQKQDKIDECSVALNYLLH